ncbi:MAG TPA: hypothetical protein VMW15_03765 [Terracidiphilus sp.]|nr:hypothetical protein [Terracidiphilus sp.]
MEGRAADLKERTLGVEVFGRPPDYDTSADPVVRFSASEVRKRIAQYYHENGEGARLQIELPLGSYVPEFLLRNEGAAGEQQGLEDDRRTNSGHFSDFGRRRSLAIAISLVGLLVAAIIAGAYSYRRFSAPTLTASDKLWGPLFNSARPVLIVVGTSHPNKFGPETAETSFFDYMTGPRHHVSLAIATALANLVGVLRQNGSSYDVKEDTETSLTDIRSRPLILIGATNNAWTMRLVTPLRFHFTPGPLAQVLDTKNPQNTAWSIDFDKPFTSVSTDYAIIARFHDSTTEGPVMVIAGIGPFGTEAASSFVATPQYLEQIAQHVPAGWQNKNLELVLKTDVIDGKAGRPVLVAFTVW